MTLWKVICWLITKLQVTVLNGPYQLGNSLYIGMVIGLDNHKKGTSQQEYHGQNMTMTILSALKLILQWPVTFQN